MRKRVIPAFFKRAVETAVVTAAYYAAARLGLLLAIPHTNASPVWPASGVALAFMLTRGFRVWPGVWLGAFLANYHTFLLLPSVAPELVFLISGLIAMGNTLETVCGTYLIRKWNGRRFSFGVLKNVFQFIGFAALACLSGAAVGPAVVSGAGLAPWSLFWDIWSTWYLGDVTGMLVVTPFLLAILRPLAHDWPRSLQNFREIFAVFIIVGALAWISFGGFFSSQSINYIFSFFFIPPLVWLALRFGMLTATAASLLVFIISVWQTVHGEGPFVRGSVQESLTLLQVFVGVGASTFLMMAAMVQERREAERALSEINDRLETRVKERTMELSLSNLELSREIETRRAAEKELRDSKKELQEFLDNMSTMSAKIGLHAEILMANKVAQAASGVAYETLLTMSFLEGPWWAFDPRVKQRVAQAFARAVQGVTINYDEKLRIGSGDIITINLSLMPVRDAGEVKYILAEGRDITAQKKAEEEIANVNRQRTLILNSAVDGIYGVDPQGRTTFVNPAALKMLGYEEHELLGKNMHSMIHHTYMDGSSFPWSKCSIFHMLEDGLPRQLDTEVLWRKDGTSFPVEYRASPLTEDKKIVGAFVAFQDITLQKLKEELDIKSRFISSVSHELRTPLTAIKESVAIVFDGSAGAINSEQKDFLDTAKRNTERLARLINNVLNFQKLDVGRAAYDKKKCRINDIVREAERAMALVAKNKGLDFSTELAEELPDLLLDKDYIMQVLVNLIDNAIKFTERGYVRVGTAQADHAVKIWVEDTGAGIRDEDVGKLFESFSQIHDPRQGRKTGGSGLGLAISKKIIEQHGGKIWAESVYKKGSFFCFLLPVDDRRGKPEDMTAYEHETLYVKRPRRRTKA